MFCPNAIARVFKLKIKLARIGLSEGERVSRQKCDANLSVALFFLVALVSVIPSGSMGQTSVASGSIQGTVSDPSDLPIAEARVTITGVDTGQVVSLKTTSAGIYTSGPLSPGRYVLRVESQGFRRTQMDFVVQVGTVSSGNVRLQVGSTTDTVEVKASAVAVNTDQATIQGVLNEQQIESLPINGRNFIDLAQLEPGVQTQNVNDSESHISRGAISIGGRDGYSGTTVEVDGLDMSDNTGNALANISASAIQEFSIAQSSADASDETTDVGAVNIVTRTGTNSLHGEALYLFRDRALAANFPGGDSDTYQRHNFAGNFGGPIVKDKLFFFGNADRYKQDLGFPVTVAPPMQDISAIVSEPLRSTLLSGRLDYNAPKGARVFYRFDYDNTKTVGAFQPTFGLLRETDNTPEHAVGIDFNSGRFIHSVRFGYAKSQNLFGDASTEPGVYNPLGNVELNFGRGFHAGPDANQPQDFYTTRKQLKYDGARPFAAHLLRYGFNYTQVKQFLFWPYALNGPVVKSQLIPDDIAKADAGPFPGGSGNPLNYPVDGGLAIQLGNGEGYITELPGFGRTAGAYPTDNRIQWYVGDTWKLKPFLTLSYSVRYVRDTNIQDYLPPIPCSAINPDVFNPTPPCSGNLLDMFGPGFGATPRQDNNNFAPQIGLAWDVFRNGKTVFRAGAGMFYQTSYYFKGNNGLGRVQFLPKGLFEFAAGQGDGEGCTTGSFRFPTAGGGFTLVTSTPPTAAHPAGLDIATQVCGQPIGSVGEDIFALSKAYQAAWTAAGPQSNPSFLGNTLAPSGVAAPNYRTPYTFNINVGMQHEIRKGLVASADYIRKVSLHNPLLIDANHVGAARFLNKTAALAAINLTNESFGCPDGTAGVQCSIGAGATMEDYAGNGLTSTTNFLGAPPSAFGLTPDQGAAFAGINPYVGQGFFYYPTGRGLYNALEVSVRQQTANPLPFVNALNLQFSYTLSRYEEPISQSSSLSVDFDHPLRTMGPANFDRTHQFSIGAVFDLHKAPKVAFIAHIASPFAQAMSIVDQGRAGEMFYTDFTGDGTTGDFLPGTRNGAFGRDVKASNLTSFLNKYNSTVAGTILPAGKALVDAGLFTDDQLIALGAVADSVPLGPTTDRANLGWLKSMDLKVSWPIKVRENVVLEPSASAFNLFNFVNYDVSPAALPSGILDGSAGSVNGTTNSLLDRGPERSGQGPGIFSLGTARQFEFGLKISF